jgi:hypothetical protein
VTLLLELRSGMNAALIAMGETLINLAEAAQQ